MLLPPGVGSFVHLKGCYVHNAGQFLTYIFVLCLLFSCSQANILFLNIAGRNPRIIHTVFNIYNQQKTRT